MAVVVVVAVAVVVFVFFDKSIQFHTQCFHVVGRFFNFC